MVRRARRRRSRRSSRSRNFLVRAAGIAVTVIVAAVVRRRALLFLVLLVLVFLVLLVFLFVLREIVDNKREERLNKHSKQKNPKQKGAPRKLTCFLLLPPSSDPASPVENSIPLSILRWQRTICKIRATVVDPSRKRGKDKK